MPNGYTRASDAWVSGLLIGLTDPGFPASHTLPDGNSVWQALTQCLGGQGNLEDLALVSNAINGPKAIWFQGATPSYREPGQTSNRQARQLIRSVSLSDHSSEVSFVHFCTQDTNTVWFVH